MDIKLIDSTLLSTPLLSNFLEAVFLLHRKDLKTIFAEEGKGIPNWLYNICHATRGLIFYEDCKRGFKFIHDKYTILQKLAFEQKVQQLDVSKLPEWSQNSYVKTLDQFYNDIKEFDVKYNIDSRKEYSCYDLTAIK
jgi:hypothetical protein